MFSFIKKFSHLPGVIQERVAFLWGLNFLYQMGFILSWVVITALFIQEFGIQMLVWLFLGEGILMILGSIIGRSFFLKYEDNRFLLGVLSTALLGVVLAFSFEKIPGIFFLIAITTKSLIYPQFRIGLHRKIESFFSPTNGRKAIPVIESAETIGTIVSAIGIVLLLENISTETLFLFWCIPLGLLLGMLFLEKHILHKIKNFSGDYHLRSKKFPEIFTCERKKDFQNILVALIFFQSMVFSVVEFEFMKEVNHGFAKEQTVEIEWDALQANVFSDGLTKVKGFSESAEKFLGKKVDHFTTREVAHENIAHDLGVLSFFFGLIALVFKLGLTSKIAKRFGVFRTMAGYFAVFFGIITTFIFGKGSWSFIRGYEHGCLSLFRSSYHLSFYSTDTKNRELLRHFLEGIVTPLGIVFSVFVILFLQKYNIPLAYSTIFLLTGTIILSASLHQKYQTYTLQNFLSADKIEEKIHLLEIIQTFRKKRMATDILSKYLKENTAVHPILRAKIIKTLSHLGDPKVVHDYLEILENPKESDDIKIKVLESFLCFTTIRAYCAKKAFTNTKLLETWQKLFRKTKNTHMKKVLIMNIFQHIPNDRIVPVFREMIENTSEELVSVCLRSCMNIDDPEVQNEIRPLLKRQNPRIRAHAVMALWESDDQKHLTGILNRLLTGKTKAENIAAIYAIGELRLRSFTKDVRSFLSTKDDELRVHTVIALLKLGKMSYIHNLLSIITSSNDAIARMAFHMRKRLDPAIREKVEISVQRHVSDKVDYVLKQEKIQDKKDFHTLSQSTKNLLKRLYHFVGRYENMYVLEKS